MTAAPNPGSTALARSAPPARQRSERSNQTFRAMVYFALAGGGDDDFARFQRNVRVVHLFFRVLFFIVKLIFLEWLLHWAHDPANLRKLLRPQKS